MTWNNKRGKQVGPWFALVLAFSLAGNVLAQGSGIKAVKPETPEVALGQAISVVIEGEGSSCGLDVDWGDGERDKLRIGEANFLDTSAKPFPVKVSHTYKEGGSYRIQATGALVKLSLPCGGEAVGKIKVADGAAPTYRGNNAQATPAARPATAPVASGPRVALVMGNGAYKDAPLKNPPNDADDIASALRDLGFQVISRKNANQREMKAAVREFGQKLRGAETALFYFAGHGLQVKGTNYLVPVAAEIDSEAEAEDQAVSLDYVQRTMEEGGAKFNVTILDACRNNPFARSFRSAAKGLAPPQSASGTLIAYATSPGSVAADGDGRNGLYTKHLLKNLREGDSDILKVFQRVRTGVVSDSGGKQTPWETTSLVGDFYFNPGAGTQVASLAPVAVPVAPTRQPTASELEHELWDSIKGSNEAAVFEEYLRQYPKGRYVAQAKVKLAGLKAEARQTATPAAAPAYQAATPQDDPDTALWKAVEQGGSLSDYEAYLKQYPKGKYVALAKTRAQQLRDDAKNQAAAAEQSLWQAAEANPSVEAYNAYAQQYPQGRYTALVEGRISKLQKEAAQAEENRLWQRAEQGSKQEVETYLSRFVSGRYAPAARLRLAQLEREEKEMKPGKVFKDCPSCPEMVVIPAGSFNMGSPSSEAGRANDEGPVHRVNVSPFALAKTEVTQGQWRVVMGSNPSNFKTCGDDCPVEQVSWNDAQDYVRKLSQQTGKRYRLPSEAEWEYACRAGGNHTYCGSNDLGIIAWSYSNSSNTTHPVGRKQANEWGLYDMSGNVWEWVEDCYHDSYSGLPTDGSAWVSGECKERGLRGGSWSGSPQNSRAAIRFRYWQEVRRYVIGFRPARMLP